MPALPVILHSRELNAENAALRDRFRGILARFQGHLTRTLREMEAEGALSATVAPEDAALLLSSLVQGAAIRWSLGSRGFSIVAEGLRLFEVQLALLGRRRDPK